MIPYSEFLPILAGPTGSGKTSLVTQLDPRIFEVVSFDSRQVYLDLPIGTTRPTSTERGKMPHSLVGILSADQATNVKAYASMARLAIESIWDRKKIPILVCGSGFYLRAFLFGMFPIPDVTEETKAEAQSIPLATVISLIKEKDPLALKNIGETDEYRIRRILEVLLTGTLWSEASQKTVGGFLEEFPNLIVKGYWLDWSRPELYKRINRRVSHLYEGGMIEETKEVISKYGESCPGLQSLGYNFVLDLLNGKIELKPFLERLAQSHRNYAKRQVTWFRKETILSPISWDEAFSEFTKIE